MFFYLASVFPLPAPTRRTSRSKPCCFLSPCSRSCVSSSYWKPRMPVLGHFEKLQRLHLCFKKITALALTFIFLSYWIIDWTNHFPFLFSYKYGFIEENFIVLAFSLIALFFPSADSFLPVVPFCSSPSLITCFAQEPMCAREAWVLGFGHKHRAGRVKTGSIFMWLILWRRRAGPVPPHSWVPGSVGLKLSLCWGLPGPHR